MLDVNELLNQLKVSKNDPQISQKLKNLQDMFLSGNKGSSVSNISPETAKRIEMAANAMKNGDKKAAQNALNQIFSTDEGKNIAMQLKNIIGK